MGYAQKMVVISGHTFSASVIYVTRMTHQHTSMVYMGVFGPARSPHHGGDAVGEGQCKVEQCLRPGLPYADGDDRRVIVEQGDGIGGRRR